MKNIVIAHISDTHNNNSFEIPECDIFIHSGDFTNLGTEKEFFLFSNNIHKQSCYFDKLQKIKNKFLSFVLLGNHDYSNDNTIANILPAYQFPITLFWNQTIDFLANNKPHKISFYNLVAPTPDYLYTKAKRQLLLENGFKDGKWANEADDQTRWKRLDSLGYCDILVSHAPPTGLNNSYYDKNGCDVCVRDYILKYQPKYVFCGHVHELNGTYKIGKTNVIVSCNTMRTFEILL